MRLEPADQKRFFHVFRALLRFVNERKQVLPVSTLAEIAALPASEVIQIRDVLWAEPTLIDEMIAANPERLSPADLELARSWKAFVRGNFFVERTLKKHAILIGDGRVYAVIGIASSISECVGARLPVYIEAVLLPYEGRIIYDGLLRLHPITFGGGTRARIGETYMAAKQQGTIIERLDEGGPTPPAPAVRADPREVWRPLVAEVSACADKLRGGNAVQVQAFALLRAIAHLTEAAVESDAGGAAMYDATRDANAAWKRFLTTLRRAP